MDQEIARGSAFLLKAPQGILRCRQGRGALVHRVLTGIGCQAIDPNVGVGGPASQVVSHHTHGQAACCCGFLVVWVPWPTESQAFWSHALQRLPSEQDPAESTTGAKSVTEKLLIVKKSNQLSNRKSSQENMRGPRGNRQMDRQTGEGLGCLLHSWRWVGAQT